MMRTVLNRPSHSSRRSAKGFALMMTIIFLVLLTSLALALGHEATSNIGIAENFEGGARAQMAAESGMDYILYHFGGFKFIGDTETTTKTMTLLGAQLPAFFNASLEEGVVTIPEMPLDDHANFSATVSMVDTTTALLTVTGTADDATRSVSIQMRVIPGDVSWLGVFPHGIMAKSPLNISGSADLLTDGSIEVSGDVMVSIDVPSGDYPALEISGSATIAGEAFASGEYGEIILGNAASVSGIKGGGDPDPRLPYVHEFCEEPAFPELDIAGIEAVIALATTPYTVTGDDTIYLDNVYIPANTNPVISNKNIVIRGVLYIEAPNDVTFTGQSEVEGVILSDPDTLSGSGTVTFTASSDINGPSTLPADVKFDAIRDLGNTGIYLPGFNIDIEGNTDVIMEGPLFASGISFTGSGELAVVGGIVVGGETMALSNLTGSMKVTVMADGSIDDLFGVDPKNGVENSFSILYTTYSETTP